MSVSVFNKENTNWKTGKYPLFLGEQLGLLDTVNTPYKRLFELYKLQKSIDWDENEMNLEQSRLDMATCLPGTRNLMIKNLAFQAELDGIAARCMAPLLAPFITNTELWLGVSKITEVENLHAITYTTIIRNVLKNPEEFFEEITKNEKIFDRSDDVMGVFDELAEAGAKYTLDKNSIPRRDLMKLLLRAYVGIYCLERLQFMSSFAATFAIGEQGMMVGIAKLVSKIAQDEQLHAAFDEEVIRILLADPEWAELYEEIKPEVLRFVNSVTQSELNWNEYLFSEGRKIVGLNQQLLDEWVLFNARVVYNFLGVQNPYPNIEVSSITWMEDWLDISKFQFAAQEGDITDYPMNVVANDVSEDEEFDFED
ncbi:ribonucleoside-diphosphate reductase 1 subunit beta [Serratia phage vB_SmaM-ChuuTotoro]|nr:ribonucleoside-diphosphate reductase 1 subunit beta [Serratia phage vB_SmaM-ChuuTotoro]